MYEFFMAEKQQISHRVCNIWQCRQTAIRFCYLGI